MYYMQYMTQNSLQHHPTLLNNPPIPSPDRRNIPWPLRTDRIAGVIEVPRSIIGDDPSAEKIARNDHELVVLQAILSMGEGGC